jgi:Tfp pilus assembly protein PilW
MRILQKYIQDKNKPLSGFTLVELLLYIAISSAMITVIITFLFTLMQTRIKNQTMAEVEQQGAQIVQLITQLTRNAEGITDPTEGSAGETLTLDVINPDNDPTIFSVDEGVLQLKEGDNDPIAITSPMVYVSDLEFSNFSKPNTPGTIKVSFTLSRISFDDSVEYNYSENFYGSISIRR